MYIASEKYGSYCFLCCYSNYYMEYFILSLYQSYSKISEGNRTAQYRYRLFGSSRRINNVLNIAKHIVVVSNDSKKTFFIVTHFNRCAKAVELWFIRS